MLLMSLIECNFSSFLHGPAVVLGPEVSVQLVLLPLDAEVEVVHGGGDLLARVPQHLDQLPRPQLVALLEEGVGCPIPTRPPCPSYPGIRIWFVESHCIQSIVCDNHLVIGHIGHLSNLDNHSHFTVKSLCHHSFVFNVATKTN